MNAHTKAHQIAIEIGKPENDAMVERQLRAADPSLRAAHTAHVHAVSRSLAYDRARMSAASLPSEDRLALAIWLVDHAEGLDPDERNHAVDVLGGLV